MTLDYGVVIPVTITVAISFGIRKLLCRESIYTMKLARHGHLMPEALHSTVHNLRKAAEIMEPRFTIVTVDHTIHELIEMIRNEPECRWILIADSEKLIGLLSREAVLEAALSKAGTEGVAAVPSLIYVSVGKDIQFYSIIVRMRLANAEAALVIRDGTVSPGSVVGIIGEEQIARTVSEGAEFFPVLTASK